VTKLREFEEHMKKHIFCPR